MEIKVNRYEYMFIAECPVDGDEITYRLTVETTHMIKAEDIREACAQCTLGFHETFAEDLHQSLGGRQTLVALHRGVLITTERGYV